MNVSVYHLSNDDNWGCRELRFNARPSLAAMARRRGFYNHICDVFVGGATGDNALEMAFHETNSIQRYWAENDTIRNLRDGNHRSTSVGDIMHCDGKWYVVKSIGFAEITEEMMADADEAFSSLCS